MKCMGRGLLYQSMLLAFVFFSVTAQAVNVRSCQGFPNKNGFNEDSGRLRYFDCRMPTEKLAQAIETNFFPNAVNTLNPPVPICSESSMAIQSVVRKLDCESILYKSLPNLLKIDPDKFVTAQIGKKFKQIEPLRVQATHEAKELHLEGWRLDQKESQLVVYRATMLEEMLNEIAPVKSTNSEANSKIHQGIDACIGWPPVNKVKDGSGESEVRENLCHRLKTLITARQRIKIAEEKYGGDSSDELSPWKTKLSPEVYLAGPRACRLLDSAIFLTLQLATNKVIDQSSAANIEALTKKIEDHIEEGVSSENFEMCKVTWPLKEEEMMHSDEEHDRRILYDAFNKYKDVEHNFGLGKKRVTDAFGVSTLKILSPEDLKEPNYLERAGQAIRSDIFEIWEITPDEIKHIMRRQNEKDKEVQKFFLQ